MVRPLRAPLGIDREAGPGDRRGLTPCRHPRTRRQRGASAALGLEVRRSSRDVPGIPVRDDQVQTHGRFAALDRHEVVVLLGSRPDQRRDAVDRPVHEFGPVAAQERPKPRLHLGQVCRGDEPSLRSSAGLPSMPALPDGRHGRYLGGHRPVAVLRPPPRCFGGRRVVKPPGSAADGAMSCLQRQ